MLLFTPTCQCHCARAAIGEQAPSQGQPPLAVRDVHHQQAPAFFQVGTIHHQRHFLSIRECLFIGQKVDSG
jgi:hypothetical protein